MQAIVYERYGPPEVLHLAEVAKPVPAADEILVKIRAVSINGSDREGLIGKPLYARLGGLFKPGSRILGSDIAGVVESVGKNITGFKPGDAVFGEIPLYHGGFAEYASTQVHAMALKPASLSFEQASSIPQGGAIALRAIQLQGQVQPGQQVLVNGAGGSAGLFAIQLAKLNGAQVTGVDNTGKLDFMRSLGADHVVDYTREDFTGNGKQYDLIVDFIAHRSVFAYRRALKPGGTYFMVGGSVGTIFQILLLGPLLKWTSDRSIRVLFVSQNRQDLLAITELVQAGKVVPVIDKTFPLSQTPDAMRFVEQGLARGKVVITVNHDDAA